MKPSREVEVLRSGEGGAWTDMDAVAVEEPLEIRVAFEEPSGLAVERSVSVTMRTPGHDEELAVGFLFTEGIVRARSDVARVRHAGATTGEGAFRNVIVVELAPGTSVDLDRLSRHFYTASSCGVCGKASIDAVRAARPAGPPPADAFITRETLSALPAILRGAQATFDATGGLHAAGLFALDARGEATLVAEREDVGRHNALDAVLGAELLRGGLPLGAHAILLSGRASFELVQKAMMANAPIVAAVGAPSSLAVELAEEHGMTLLGFVREGRFNVYAGSHRVMV